ncbi:hypothetical protein J1N35_015388 [Gossypium stocksii]|uniref:Uncharacterized protein n=1 Tax=Gossypium stocksii TaxID=47602 RepID=A0A9D4AAT0_9ROSI|nr:hypothetical protein J1N35_015388 [Gossypium stocksii]
MEVAFLLHSALIHIQRRSRELTIAYAFHTLGPAEYNYNVDALTDDEVIQVGNEWQLADVG